MTTNTQLARRRWLVLASAVLSDLAAGTTVVAMPPLVPRLATAALVGALIAVWIREPRDAASARPANAGTRGEGPMS
jgi:hypothetical protein